MRIRPLNLIVAITASAALAQFLVLFYNHWYFAGTYWPKWLALGVLLLPVYIGLLRSRWEKVWLGLGIYWTLLVAGFMVGGGGYDLSHLGFTSVLNLEAPMVWLPAGLIMLLSAIELTARERALSSTGKQDQRALQLRRRLRRRQGRGIATASGGAAVLASPPELSQPEAAEEAVMFEPYENVADGDDE